MAEGKWVANAYGSDFIVNGKTKGYILADDYDPGSDVYLAAVYPPNSLAPKTLVNAPAADAKKAVEEYWADKLSAY